MESSFLAMAGLVAGAFTDRMTEPTQYKLEPDRVAGAVARRSLCSPATSASDRRPVAGSSR
jgi:hypothetical protein